MEDLGNFSNTINEIRRLGSIFDLSSEALELLKDSFKELSAAQILTKLSTSMA